MDEKIYVSAEKLSELKKELEELKTVKRREVAERINEAKDLGDLSENAEYQQARDEQGFIEGRVMELEDMLKRVQVVDKTQATGGTVRVGSKVRVKQDANDTEQFEIVGSQEADPINYKISNASPLGKVLLGRKAGDTVIAQLPNGERTYLIVAVE